MSSLRNAVKRRVPKERSQPAARQKFGLLEKHKDYVLRAKNFHSKQERLQKLREKAAFRNEDEFYFRMERSEVKDGVHRSNKRQKRTHEALKAQKTQDLSYVTLKTTMEAQKIRKLEAGLHMLGEDGPKNTHTIFFDSEDEARSFDPTKHFQTAPELSDRAHNRPRLETLQTQPVLVGKGVHGEKGLEKLAKQREAQYRELAERLDREQKLKKVMVAMSSQKALMGKGRRKKVAEATEDHPAVFRWKAERKR
eukprot:tig00020903_g15115.t1